MQFQPKQSNEQSGALFPQEKHTMKVTFRKTAAALAAFVGASLLSTGALADDPIYINGSRAAEISSSGVIYKNGSRVAEIDSSGTVYKNGSRVGEITSSGAVYKNGSRIGEVSSSGTLYLNGSRVGEVPSSNRIRAAAYYFFFW